MVQLLWVCLGGAFGTGARYLLSGWIQRAAGGAFPWWTLAVNVIGSFLLAWLVAAAPRAGWLTTTTHLALAAGVMGGFTTYSSFNQETLTHLKDGAYALAAAYVTATWMACLASGALGAVVGRLATGA